MTALGVDSVDGTYIAFGPDKNAVDVLDWIEWHNIHTPLFEATK